MSSAVGIPLPLGAGGCQGDCLAEAFEAFMSSSRRNRGVKKAAELLNKFEDGTYINEHVQRHWWTWQQACAALSASKQGGKAEGEALTDEQLAAIAYKGFNDYWTEDCAGKDLEAWAASAKAVIAAFSGDASNTEGGV